MSNGSTFVSPHCWTNNVRQFDPSLTHTKDARTRKLGNPSVLIVRGHVMRLIKGA